MNPLPVIRIALHALRLNALRSALAMLGVVIGVALVIVMVSISAGAKQSVENQIRALGTNMLMVVPGSTMASGRQSGAGSAPPFSEADVAAIRRSIPGIAHLSGSISGTAQLIAGRTNWQTQVYGVHEEYLDARGWGLAEGRNFTPAEIRSGAKVAILGATVAQKLFGDEAPVGQAVRIRNVPFTVVGVLEIKGQSMMGTDQDDVALAPISTARRSLFGGKETVPDRVNSIMVEVAEGEDIAAVQAELETLMRARRHVRATARDDFTVRNMAEFIRTRTAMLSTLGVLLGATALISLVVGGIGIMNIMLVSVTERTREIGIRLAVGARRSDILNQFLVEAVTLCLFGGIAGVGLGSAGTFVVAELGTMPVVIDAATVALAMISAATVGVVFGLYPARRAARLNPIEALRFE